MTRSYFSRLIICIYILILVAMSLSSCTIVDTRCVFDNYVHNEKPKKPINTFTFEENNTLEVIVSENEKFILYFPANETYIHEQTGEPWHRGYGEWIKDGVAIPVRVREEPEDDDRIIFDANETNYEYRGFEISYDVERARNFNCAKNIPDASSYIALVVNDTENSVIKWWDSGYYPYNVKWDAPNDVMCNTYSRSEDDKWNYVDDDYWEFIHYDENEECTYSCDSINFSYDSMTKQGVWITNETTVPIRIEFDTIMFMIRIYDISTNKEILEASGYIRDENTAVFNEYWGDMIYADSVSEFIVEKRYVE